MNKTKDIPIIVETFSSGQSPNGVFRFSTYPVNCLNYPYPQGTIAANWDSRQLVDRFWIVDANYSSRPNIDLILRYTDEDLNLFCNEKLDEDRIQALRYDQVNSSWTSYDASGINNAATNTIHIAGINGAELEKDWVLYTADTSDFIKWPTAFTPNNDGLNDHFGPVGTDLHLYKFKILVFNRYGEMIYQSEDIFNAWDGKIEKYNELAPMGTYTYSAQVEGLGIQKNFTGQVTLIR